MCSRVIRLTEINTWIRNTMVWVCDATVAAFPLLCGKTNGSTATVSSGSLAGVNLKDSGSSILQSNLEASSRLTALFAWRRTLIMRRFPSRSDTIIQNFWKAQLLIKNIQQNKSYQTVEVTPAPRSIWWTVYLSTVHHCRPQCCVFVGLSLL